MVIDVQECYLVVLFAKDEKDCVEKVDQLQDVEQVGNLHKCVTFLRVVILRLGDAEKPEVLNLLGIHEDLKSG